MNKIFSIILILAVFWFGAKALHKDTWRGFYYPQGSLVGPYVYSPEYSTKEDCISWAENEWKLRPEDADIAPQDLYECGKNCKLHDPNNPGSIYVCEVNFDGGDWRRADYGE